MTKPKKTRMILPPDFPMPGTSTGRSKSSNGSRRTSRVGGGLLRMLLWPFFSMAMSHLMAVIIVPVILLGLAWWYFPIEVSWITSLVTSTGNVFDVKAWQS